MIWHCISNFWNLSFNIRYLITLLSSQNVPFGALLLSMISLNLHLGLENRQINKVCSTKLDIITRRRTNMYFGDVFIYNLRFTVLSRLTYFLTVTSIKYFTHRPMGYAKKKKSIVCGTQKWKTFSLAFLCLWFGTQDVQSFKSERFELSWKAALHYSWLCFQAMTVERYVLTRNARSYVSDWHGRHLQSKSQ